MERRELLAGLAATAVFVSRSEGATVPNTYLELKTWRMHNTPEEQNKRVAEFLHTGLAPALSRSGSKLAGAFSTMIGPDGPSYYTLTEFSSLAAMQQSWEHLAGDSEFQKSVDKLGSGSGLPFVGVESSLLRSFDVMPQVTTSEAASPRIFELRTYQSQTFATLKRKVAMFNDAEAKIFENLGMRPVFFGETLIGPRQPNLTYMLSYDDLAAREKLWQKFGSDPAWKKLSGRPELKDAQIVANISNIILQPLPFSPIR